MASECDRDVWKWECEEALGMCLWQRMIITSA